MRKKIGWSAFGLVGFIFAPIGFLFLVLGLILSQSPSAIWPDGQPSVMLWGIFCALGSVFLLLGLFLLAVDLRRRRRLLNALQQGNCVEAKIIGLSTRNNVTVNGRHPYVLECAWTDPAGVVHIYRSRDLYFDVSGLLKSDTVPVYIDRYDDSVGFVDVDAVLPEIRIHP